MAGFLFVLLHRILISINMLNFCAISDLHGQLPDPDTFKECDVLLICGDFVDLYIQHYNVSSRQWFIDSFLPWIARMPMKQVFMVGGNHDGWAYKQPDELRELCKGTKLTYLLDETAIVKDGDREIVIYGTPWCHKFGNWYFMDYTDKEMREKVFTSMPKGIDILISHDPPHGACDVVLQKNVSWANDEHIGNKALRDAIKKKKPVMCLCGHIHSGNHEWETLGVTKVRNVSLLNEHYILKYDPFYFEY